MLYAVTKRFHMAAPHVDCVCISGEKKNEKKNHVHSKATKLLSNRRFPNNGLNSHLDNRHL